MAPQYFVGDFDEKGPVVGLLKDDGSFIKFLMKPGLLFIRNTIDFAWQTRFGGAALTQLAVAMLLYTTLGDHHFAHKFAEEFKNLYLTGLPDDMSWRIPVQVVSHFVREKMSGRMPT